MKLLRQPFPVHFYKTISDRTAQIDLSRVTVVFGANGSGKTNLLEAIAWSFEYLAGTERPARTRGAPIDWEDSLPGSVFVQLDRSDEPGTVDHRLAWTLLTGERTAYGFGFTLGWKELSSPARSELECIFSASDAPESSRTSLARVIELWAQAIAETGGAGSYEDRLALVRPLLEQRSFLLPEGEPVYVPARLSSEARAAAERVAAEPKQLVTDPLWESARWIASGSWRDSPTTVGDPVASLDWRPLDEFDELVSGVWFIDRDRAVAGEVGSALRVEDLEPLEARANSLLPRFAAHTGSVSFDLVNRELVIRFRENDGQVRNLGDLGAGVSRWVSIAAEAAIRESTVASPVRLWLLDEPEAHLHLNAIRDLSEWLVRRYEEGTGLVVATHALELLDLPTDRAEFLLLSRGEGGWSHAAIAENLIDSLEAYASEIGIDRADALRVARGFLVVEGKNDRRILQHFYGERLAQERVVVLPLQGIRNALALVEVRYLAKLGLPIVFLCDKARARFLENDNVKPRTDEEFKVHELWTEARRDPTLTEPAVVSHGQPDVMFCLPESAVQSVVGAERFHGWEPFRERYSKKRIHDAFGISNDAAFIETVLEACDRTSRPAKALEDAMEKAFAIVSSEQRAS